MIAIPPQVFYELELSNDRPGTKAILEAIDAGWIKLEKIKKPTKLKRLHLLVDAGEADATLRALEHESLMWIMDDKKLIIL